MAYGKKWNRREILIAMSLYCQLPFGQCNSRNKLVTKIAEKIERTPGSLSMKLGNLASLDPAQKLRGVKGLDQASNLDRSVWNEFQANWFELSAESESEFQKLFDSKKDESTQKDVSTYTIKDGKNTIITEKEALIKRRLGQTFFRKTILASYDFKCCITGNPVPELLRASHILPWSKFPEHRVDPCNGLCLGAIHDAAFDRGLVSFDKNYKLIVSHYLKDFYSNQTILQNFSSLEGMKINLPDKFMPNPAFLQKHREHFFLD